MKREKKEVHLRFSYLDVFFLLLAGCLLSIGIYFFAEDSERVTVKREYRVEASAYYREELYSALPVIGESLYDENGERIGSVLACSVENGNAYISFSLEVTPPDEGETMMMETAKAVKKVKIVNVEKIGEEEIV